MLVSVHICVYDPRTMSLVSLFALEPIIWHTLTSLGGHRFRALAKTKHTGLITPTVVAN